MGVRGEDEGEVMRSDGRRLSGVREVDEKEMLFCLLLCSTVCLTHTCTQSLLSRCPSRGRISPSVVRPYTLSCHPHPVL